MTKKDFLLALGERSVNPGDTDELLRSKISERKRKEIMRQEELDELEHEAKKAELGKKTKRAETETEKIEKKVEAPESPIKMEGRINLGEIDLQKDREEARREAKEAQQAMAQEIEGVKKERDAYREELNNERIESVKTTLKTQIEEQNKRLDELIKANASRGSIIKQLDEMKETAKQLGFVQSQGAGDIMAQIELKKLDFELEDRKFAHEITLKELDDKRADRQEELRDKREFQKAQLAQQEKKDEWFRKAPTMLGEAIGQGIMANRGGGAGRVAEEAPSAPKAPRGKQSHHVEAGLGDSGEIECPGCNQPIAIGPTARAAVCTNCGEKVPIRRVGEKPLAKEEEE